MDLISRRIRLLAVAALMAALMVVMAAPAFAFANPDSKGNAQNAAGQTQAKDNANQLNVRQDTTPIGGPSENGPKGGRTVPNNADHFYQDFGFIGKDRK